MSTEQQANYYNYFTEIEEYFCRRRGTVLLLSSRDWAEIDEWQRAAIPLEAVLKGIDRAFESHRKGSGSGRVNSLAYCSQAVLAAAADAARLDLAHPSAGNPFPPEKLLKYLTSNALLLPKAAEKFEGDAGAELRAMAVDLLQLADACLDAETNNSQPDTNKPPTRMDLEQIEQRLTALENRMVAVLEGAAEEVALSSWRSEFRSTMAERLSRMDAAQLANLERQFLTRKLLERAGLARLSLFYYMEQ